MKTTLVALVTLAVLAACVPFNAGAQTFSASSDPTSVSFSENELVSRGFVFDDRSHPMCTITGPDGPCRVAAFVFGEKDYDPARYTCSKLNRATYVGHCVKGKLHGFSLVIADGSTKLVKEAFISYFHKGRIAYPALTSFLTDTKNFVVVDPGKGYGCVFFGKWNSSVERCAQFIDIYGKDIFTESNAQALRDGTFDLSHYATKFVEFVQRKGIVRTK